jgi:hypothetical protein
MDLELDGLDEVVVAHVACLVLHVQLLQTPGSGRRAHRQHDVDLVLAPRRRVAVEELGVEVGMVVVLLVR